MRSQGATIGTEASDRVSVVAWALLLSLALSTPAAAGPRIAIPQSLKQSAMSCLAEALRLCPNALAAKDHGVACVLARRRELSRECQGLADQALRFLNGQDVHIDLRPRRPR